MIEFIKNEDLKEEIARAILLDLPDWFGIPASTENYITQSRNLPFFAFKNNEGNYIGFIVLDEKSKITLDIFVFGVKKAYHRQGIGRLLVTEAINYAKEHRYRYLTVKTLDDCVDDESYRRTRMFYYQMGFEKFEVFPTLWDEYNICLLMIYDLNLK